MGRRFSLFFVKKRAFKMFKKESKQDLYSTKSLLNKAFNVKVEINTESEVMRTPYYNHLVIRSNFLLSNCYFCIHCGMKAG